MARNIDPLRQQLGIMRQSLFDEKILNDYFETLEKLETVEHPNFAEEVVGIYFRESTRLIALVERDLAKTPLDFMTLDRYLYQLKSSSGSVGAQKVLTQVNSTRKFVEQRDIESAKNSLERLKMEHDCLRSRIEPYFQLLRQAGPSEPAQRPK